MTLAFTPAQFPPLRADYPQVRVGSRIAFYESEHQYTGTVVGSVSHEAVAIFLDPCFHAGSRGPVVTVWAFPVRRGAPLIVQLLGQ